jgi:hypothetical protein
VLGSGLRRFRGVLGCGFLSHRRLFRFEVVSLSIGGLGLVSVWRAQGCCIAAVSRWCAGGFVLH